MKKLSLIAAGLLLSAGLITAAANFDMGSKKDSTCCEQSCDKSTCDESDCPTDCIATCK